MKTAVINFKVDPIIKAKAQKYADEQGVTLSMILNNHLRELAGVKALPIKFPAEQMTSHMERIIEEVRMEIARGEVSPDFDADDIVGMRHWLNTKYDD